MTLKRFVAIVIVVTVLLASLASLWALLGGTGLLVLLSLSIFFALIAFGFAWALFTALGLL
jgi:hypothetical protein